MMKFAETTIPPAATSSQSTTRIITRIKTGGKAVLCGSCTGYSTCFSFCLYVGWTEIFNYNWGTIFLKVFKFVD